MTDRQKGAIWLVDVASGRQRPLVEGASQPRWSPDGRRLAYVAADAKGNSQLFVRWIAEDATVRVTGLPDSPSNLLRFIQEVHAHYLHQRPLHTPVIVHCR